MKKSHILEEKEKRSLPLVVRIWGRKGEPNQLFGVKSDEKGHWIPISKKVMEDCHCTAPDGSTLKPEENLIYTEISKW